MASEGFLLSVQSLDESLIHLFSQSGLLKVQLFPIGLETYLLKLRASGSLTKEGKANASAVDLIAKKVLENVQPLLDEDFKRSSEDTPNSSALFQLDLSRMIPSTSLSDLCLLTTIRTELGVLSSFEAQDGHIDAVTPIDANFCNGGMNLVRFKLRRVCVSF